LDQIATGDLSSFYEHLQDAQGYILSPHITYCSLDVFKTEYFQETFSMHAWTDAQTGVEKVKWRKKKYWINSDSPSVSSYFTAGV